MSYIDFYEIPGNCPLENELRMNVSLKKKMCRSFEITYALEK